MSVSLEKHKGIPFVTVLMQDFFFLYFLHNVDCSHATIQKPNTIYPN